MDVLTKRQADILQAIKEFMAKNGYPPTVREIGSQVGLSSPATIQFHLTQLEQKGYIKKSNAKNRTIELLVPNELAQTDDDVVNVPLVGKVTAGTPIEAIEMPNEFFSLPTALLPAGEEVFTLKFLVNR